MNAEYTGYQLLQPARPTYGLLLIVLMATAAFGAYSAYHMEHTGHIITGMNNQIVWGLPHVFAISLIVTASGALNGATMASVFGVSLYKPYARLSVVLAMAMLAGGLVVLVLDLGRPDRLVVALTTYNFRSIFSWNIYLYSGFMLVCVFYLWMMIDRKFNRFAKMAGTLAFLWRIVLTTGTGCIFGFLVGRSALDSAILAPLFIALSFVTGTATLALVMASVAHWQDKALPPNVVTALGKLLFWSVLVLAYFSIAHHLTNSYIEQHQADEEIILGRPLGGLFWAGHIIVGMAVPLLLLLISRKHSGVADNPLLVRRLLLACGSALLGGVVLVYLIVIGSQTGAQHLFPGRQSLQALSAMLDFPLTRLRTGNGGLVLVVSPCRYCCCFWS